MPPLLHLEIKMIEFLAIIMALAVGIVLLAFAVEYMGLIAGAISGIVIVGILGWLVSLVVRNCRENL